MFSLKFSNEDPCDEDAVEDREGAGDGVCRNNCFCWLLPFVDEATSACKSNCLWFNWSSSILGRGETLFENDDNSWGTWACIVSVVDRESEVGTICVERCRRNLRLCLFGEEGSKSSDDDLSILIHEDSSCL